jgi:lipopolysaccharide biosynthesis glycosyltransferase
MHLAIAFDQGYAQPFFALLHSIFENNKGVEFTIHSIVHDISENEKNKISAYCKEFNSNILFYEINFEENAQLVLLHKWTSAVYYRLYFPQLVKSEKLLYLDADTLVIGRLEPLYHTEMGRYPIAAVDDNYVMNHPEIGIEGEGNYFNSGVMLINVPEWRNQAITEKVLRFLKEHAEKIKFVDQDGLNAVLKDNWLKLDWKYNVIYSRIPKEVSKRVLDQFIQDKVIIHFTLERPWNRLCKNRFRNLYYRHLKKSPLGDRNPFVTEKVSLMSLLQLRLMEYYFDCPFIGKLWRALKMSQPK